MSKGGRIIPKLVLGPGLAFNSVDFAVVHTRTCSLQRLNAGEDPAAALQKWEKERGDRKQKLAQRSLEIQLSVQQALIASKLEVQEVKSESRRRRSRSRTNRQYEAMNRLSEHSGNVYTPEFWAAQDRRDADDRYRRSYSADEPKDTDREK